MRFHSVEPIAGESIYSILSRLYVLEANASPLVTLKSWTGIRGYKPLSGLPTHLDFLANQLGLPDGPIQLIRAHTHFPLYAHFLDEKRKQLLIEAMLYSGAPKSRVGLLRNDLGASDRRRYCSSCERLDIERYGVALWHREHSIPGVSICPDHGEPLIEIASQGAFGERQLGLPGFSVLERSHEDFEIKEKLYYLARQIKVLMERRKPVLISTDVYRRLLKEAGFVTRNGHVRQRHVMTLVADWLSPLKNVSEFERIISGLDIERNWVAEIVAGDQRFHHPLKHMVLWGALNLDAVQVLNTASAYGEQLELPLSGKKPVVLSRDLVEEMLTAAGSFNQAAKIIGVDVSTLIVAAESYGVPVKRRPKKVTAELRHRIAKEPAEVAASVLAARYKVSITTVNRIRRANQPKDNQIQLNGL